MKRSRFNEEQIIAILKEQESAGDGGPVSQARHLQCDLLQVESQVWRPRRIGRPAAEDAGGREHPSQEASGRGDARQYHSQGCCSKRMVTPDAKRDAVAHVCLVYGVSQRRACEALAVDRPSVRYRSLRPDDRELREAMKAVAAQRRRFGYRRIHVMLQRQGIEMNIKKLRRLYAEEKLQVRKRGGRKRALGTRRPIIVPDQPNQR